MSKSNIFNIHKDIRKAATLPSPFYKDMNVFTDIRKKIFLSSWQFVGGAHLVEKARSVYPFVLLDRYLTEPMVLTRDEDGEIHCLSNVCTHRANLVVLEAGKSKKLNCMYHGRRFDLKGKFEYMPEFQEADNFPSACDHLYEFPTRHWGPLIFAGLNPSFDFQTVIDKMMERVGFLSIDDFFYDESLSREYTVNAHWALYCDNYLEGFHVPFVHEALNKVLEYGSYTTEIYEHCNLQIGYAEQTADTFDLPEDHMDFGKNVAAYYYWVFPNMMFNFYPWGLSLNIVKPIDISHTRVSFISYVKDASKLNKGAGNELDKVELEDEFVVENVQKGIHSSFYNSGRFSPKMEKGVHHFHLLLSKFMNA